MKIKFKEVLRLLRVQDVKEMTKHERCYHMKYDTPWSKEVWKHIAPKGVWFIRAAIMSYTLALNFITVWLVYHLAVLDGIPILGSLAY